MKKRLFIIFLLLAFLNTNCSIALAIDTKFPNYSQEFLGKDTFEKFNRKVFNFNLKINNYAIKPLHIIWSSIMPIYGMNRLQGITNNIEYPIRVVSCLIQRDFKTAKNETIRFLTNTNQLKKLKQYTKNKTILIDNGAHLGFLYRQEFLDSLNNTINEFKNYN